VQRTARVSRRFSVLKVLGRTEAEISPYKESEDAPRAALGEGAASKRRRTSRVSFGHIQTAIFQKDADRNDTPSPASSLNGSNVPRTNLSTVPDITMVSPAASTSPAGSDVAMDITGRASFAPMDITRTSIGGARDSLPGLPQAWTLPPPCRRGVADSQQLCGAVPARG
jgi:hypothetical protein